MHTMVWQNLADGWRWFWRRVSVNFALGLLAMGLVAVLVWSFDLIDDDARGVVLTAASGTLPVTLLVGPERTLAERLKVDWGLLGTIFLLLTALLLAISHRQGWSSLGLNVGILLFSSPILLVVGRLVFRKPLLGVGLGMPMTMAMAALIVLVIPRKILGTFCCFRCRRFCCQGRSGRSFYLVSSTRRNGCARSASGAPWQKVC